MQYNNRAILAMIASTLNHDVDEIYLTDGLTKLDMTPDRDALTVYMVDGRQFQITVEEVI